MEIHYSQTRELSPEDLQNLFLSVEWDSGNHPEQLARAMRGTHRVFTAWDKGLLVGLASAISDGAMTAYVQYLVVRPEHQGRGIGSALLRRLLDEYRDLPRTALIAYEDKTGFYEKCGFTLGAGKAPMFVTTLST